MKKISDKKQEVLEFLRNKKTTIPVSNLWNEIRILIDNCEIDAYKNGVKHQLMPGIRLRHALRTIKAKIQFLILLSHEVDKRARAKRRAHPSNRKKAKEFLFNIKKVKIKQIEENNS